MIDAAIVGLGWWGQRIISSLHNRSDKIQIVLGIDHRPDAGSELPDKQRPHVVTDYYEALSNPKIDAVILATPHSLHEEQIILSANAGKHVFCEKPLALNKKSAERAITACDEANVLLGIGHMRRYEPSLLHIKNLVDRGELGTLMHVEANFSHDVLANVDSKDWRASTAESPIPALSGMAIHLTDAYIHLFGPIDEVFAYSTQRCGNWGSGDTLSVQFRFKSGMTGSLSTILVTPIYIRFQVFGAQAWVEALSDVHPGQEGITQLTVARTGEQKQVRKFNYVDTVLTNLEAFADAVECRSPYPFTRAEKLENVAVMEAIIESAVTGRPVTP
ncbi:MAG: Gfo/Idh/MocA family protein [Candidatus Rariloculaceae bacterium]